MGQTSEEKYEGTDEVVETPNTPVGPADEGATPADVPEPVTAPETPEPTTSEPDSTESKE